LNYYKRHLGDYARDTAHLSMAEDGAYNRLLDFYYAAERPLPLERAEIYRRVRARGKQDQAAVDAVLADFFNLKDDGWHHKRCDEEIAAMMEKAQTNRENGKGGGRPKKKPNNNPEKTQSVSGGNDGGLRLETLAIKPLATTPLANSQGTSKTGDGATKTDPDPIFGTCLQFLTGKGVDEPHGRSFLGLLRKQYPDTLVFEVVDAARKEDVSKPIPWINKAIQARSANRKDAKHGNFASQDYRTGVGPDGSF